MAGRDSPPTAAAATVESVGQCVEIFSSCIISLSANLAYLRKNHISRAATARCYRYATRDNGPPV